MRRWTLTFYAPLATNNRIYCFCLLFGLSFNSVIMPLNFVSSISNPNRSLIFSIFLNFLFNSLPNSFSHILSSPFVFIFLFIEPQLLHTRNKFRGIPCSLSGLIITTRWTPQRLFQHPLTVFLIVLYQALCVLESLKAFCFYQICATYEYDFLFASQPHNQAFQNIRLSIQK